MTISLKRNNVPLARPVPLFARFSQTAAEFSAKRKQVAQPAGTQFVGLQQAPAPNDTTPVCPVPTPVTPDVAGETAPVESYSEVPLMTQISMPTRALWRAWREKSDVPGMTVLRVVGLCPSVPGVSGRVLLQESISADLGNHWGGEGAKSGLLVLERLMVPPALGDTEASAVNPQQIRLPAYPWCYPWEVNEENNKAQPLLITFRKDEKNTRPSQSQMPSPLSAPSYTHVTILPDEITVPIQ